MMSYDTEEKKTEAQIKDEAIALIRQKIEEIKQNSPKAYKQNIKEYQILEQMTADQLEIYYPAQNSIEEICDLQFDAHRYYHDTDPDYPHRDYREDPVTTTIQEICLSDRIYIINETNPQYKALLRRELEAKKHRPCIVDDVYDYSLQEKIKKQYEIFYKKVNEVFLYNFPRPLSKIELRYLQVLEKKPEEMEALVLLNFKSTDGYDIKTAVATYDAFYDRVKCVNAFGGGYDAQGNYCSCGGRLKPTILKRIGSVFEDIFDAIAALFGF